MIKLKNAASKKVMQLRKGKQGLRSSGLKKKTGARKMLSKKGCKSC